ncbi:MAG TPA: PAS domain S-box protein [Opitutaceae bacterium]|nr:PAS domain S-box protein [Opitutaceae bacterium]
MQKSEMGKLIAAYPWTETPFNRLESWPSHLRMVVNLMLEAGAPMAVVWGKDYRFLYNDRYRKIIQDKHPAALGAPGEKIFPEIWPEVLPLVEQAYRGEPVVVEDVAHSLNRGGETTEAFFSGSYNPIRNESGVVDGFLAVVTETTVHVARERQRAQIFDTTLSTIVDFAYSFDLDGRFLYVNKPLLDLWGRKLEDVVGKNFFDLKYPDELAGRLQRQIQEVFERKQALRDETPYVSPTGVTGYYEYIFSPVFAEDGSVVVVAGSTREISNRKKLERDIRDVQMRMEAALDAGEIGTWTWNIVTDQIFADRNLARFYSVSEHEANGGGSRETFASKIHPEDADRVKKIVAAALCKGNRYDADYRVLNSDGTVRWLEVRSRVERDLEGRAVSIIGVAHDVTERRNTEEALRRSEERYLTLFNSIESGFCIIEVLFDEENKSSDYRFLEVNPAFEKQTGLVNVVGKRMYELLPKKEAYWAEIYGRVALTGEPARFQNWVAELGRWYDVNAFRFGPPKSRQVAIVFNDVTAQKRAEEELRDTKARLETTLGATEVATWNWDIHNNRVFADHNMARLFSLTLEDAMGGPIENYLRAIHPEDRARVETLISEALQDPSGYLETDCRLLQADGSVRWVTARGVIERDEEDQPHRFPGVIIDITGRKQAEAALRRSEERATNIIESITDGFMAMDQEWRITYLNRRAEEIFRPLQKTHANTLGRIFWDEFPETVGTIFEESYYRAVRGQMSVAFEVFYPLLGRWFDVCAYPSCEGLSIYFVDITERKQAEEALARARAELERTNQNLEATVAARTRSLRESIGVLEAFSYSVSHDLRGPLRVMGSFAQALKQDYSASLDSAAMDYIRRIVSASERMDHIIEDVLVYSRISRDELKLEPIALAEFIPSLLEAYPQFRKEAATITLRSPLPIVMAHQAALTQCISNLIGNAVKFVAPGNFPEIEIWAEVSADRARLFVRDNGIGIEPSVQKKIFGDFYRLESKYPGTGIGLAIVKKAMERMGGSVGLYSEPGKGSTFYLDIPVAPLS